VNITVDAIGIVPNTRRDPADTGHWGDVISTILIDERSGQTACKASTSSHVEVLFHFNQAQELSSYHARPSRGRPDLPAVGVFADRGPAAPTGSQQQSAASCQLRADS
jgi:tRNA (adenine37-N6)-methyltransferase